MPPVPPARFARSLRRMGPEGRAAFVADLWAARGFDTERSGGTVIAERRGTTVRIDCASGPIAGRRTDIVIDGRTSSSDVSTSGRRIGPSELRHMLLYAVDREQARRIYTDHFDHAFDPDRAPGSPLGRLTRSRPRTTLVLLVVIGVIGVSAAAPSGSLFAGSPPATVTAAPSPAGQHTPEPSDTDSAPSGGAGDRPAGGGDLFRYPPGIGPSGITDASALADAHRVALAGETWRLRLTHNRSLDLMHPFRNWLAAEQVVVRIRVSRYRFEHTGRAAGGDGSRGVMAYVDYGDGTANYRRLIGLNGEVYRRTQLPAGGAAGVFTNLSAAYVERYLSTTESRVESVQVDNATRQRVVATGQPTAIARTVRDYTAIAVIDRRGVVRTLRVEYTLLERVPDPTPNGIATPYGSPDEVPTEPVGRVRFTFVLSGIGNTTLETPGWYVEAVGATNATGVPPWPNDPAV